MNLGGPRARGQDRPAEAVTDASDSALDFSGPLHEGDSGHAPLFDSKSESTTMPRLTASPSRRGMVGASPRGRALDRSFSCKPAVT
jgi:hypothetical protein